VKDGGKWSCFFFLGLGKNVKHFRVDKFFILLKPFMSRRPTVRRVEEAKRWKKLNDRIRCTRMVGRVGGRRGEGRGVGVRGGRGGMLTFSNYYFKNLQELVRKISFRQKNYRLQSFRQKIWFAKKFVRHKIWKILVKYIL
jgi:hypothetical protein